MSEHPIECLMTTAMNSIQDMIDVNTIIGEPIETSNNIVIIPISKVSLAPPICIPDSSFKTNSHLIILFNIMNSPFLILYDKRQYLYIIHLTLLHRYLFSKYFH